MRQIVIFLISVLTTGLKYNIGWKSYSINFRSPNSEKYSLTKGNSDVNDKTVISKLDSDFNLKDATLLDSKEYYMNLFREYAQEGLHKFKLHDLEGSIACLQKALRANSTQPLGQLGIFLYCNEQYDEAAIQLSNDIKKIESSKRYKANDFRIWLCAALNKLSRPMEAIEALDLQNKAIPDYYEQRILMNYTLHFYGGDKPLDEMIDFIDRADEKDISGRIFYGNFYLGLYFDSICELTKDDSDFDGVAERFLRVPAHSRKYREDDMWFHLPRILYDKRFISK